MELISGIIVRLLTIAGSIGLFLFGMKLMSESLQKFTGSRFRRWFGQNLSNPWRGLLAGVVITGIAQSSSAVTVVLLSFVNAGLISFRASLGVVFGANIGTTVTAWLISLAGMERNFDITSFILPLIGIILPFFLSSRNQWRVSAEFVIGFAILFIGINLFKDHIPAIENNYDIFSSLKNLTDIHFLRILIFVFSGLIITILLQSSSATIAFTMVLAADGYLEFQDALAMVLGENIGTTFTAIFASLMANRTAKRTALSHLLFNVIGVIWALILFDPYRSLIDLFIQQFSFLTGKAPETLIPVGIAFFHSSFNIINALLFMLFFSQFELLCEKLLPNSAKPDFNLKYIGSGMISVPELSVIQVKMEIAQMGQHIARIYRLIPDLLTEKNEKKFTKKFTHIENYEQGIDELEENISTFISKLLQGNLSEINSIRLHSMLRLIDSIENLADTCYQMALTIKRKNQALAWFTPELRSNIEEMMKLIDLFVQVMNKNLQADFGCVDFIRVQELEDQVNKLRNELKANYIERLKNNEFPHQTGIFYNDLLGLLEKAGDYIYQINLILSHLGDKKGN